MRFNEINSHTHVVEQDGKLMELSFHGSQCTKDCSGHRAGYKWSLDRGGVENPASNSQSFVNGANIGVRMMNQRPQGGGRLPGYASQTTNAVKKRAQRAAAAQQRAAQTAQPPATGPLPISEFASGSDGGESGRWYTDDDMVNIVGDGWWQDLDLSGASLGIPDGDVPKEYLIQEAQAWLSDQGYSVQVLNVRVNDDDCDWYIEGSFHNPRMARGHI